MAKQEPVAVKPAESEPKLVEPKVAAPAPVAPALASASAIPAIIAPEPAAKFQLASVPMPPTRPDFEPAPKREAKPARRTARLHEPTVKRPVAEVRAKPEPRAKADGKPDPVGAVQSFVKKLLTPDKNARKSTVEAEADPPSHIQPPQ
jgi:hypothetical protein